MLERPGTLVGLDVLNHACVEQEQSPRTMDHIRRQPDLLAGQRLLRGSRNEPEHDACDVAAAQHGISRSAPPLDLGSCGAGNG